MIGIHIHQNLATSFRKLYFRAFSSQIKHHSVGSYPLLATPKGKIVAIGGAAVDIQLSAREGQFELYKSCIGQSKLSLGGVARNIVDCSSKLGISSILIAAIGNDNQANIINSFCSNNKIKLCPIHPSLKHSTSFPTGKYYAILDHKRNELLGISQMQINELLTFSSIKPFLQIMNLSSEDIIVLDSNIPDTQLMPLTEQIKQKYKCMIVYETKGLKSKRIVTSGSLKNINLLKMNYLQKMVIQKALGFSQQAQVDSFLVENIGLNLQQNVKLQAKVIITKGNQSIQVLRKDQKSQMLKVPIIDKIDKTTGAGDTFTGAFCSLLQWGASEQIALVYARAASKLNIESPVGVSVISDSLNMEELKKSIISGWKY